MFSNLKTLAMTGLASSGLGLATFAVTLPVGADTVCAQTTKVETIWSSPAQIEGRGVTNCGRARADSDVRAACQARANNDASILAVENVEFWNYSFTPDVNWKGERSCVYRATYRCQFLKRAV